ncbi:MAG: hypothetical protein FWD35_00875 [Oscillospiraceae bacterium]|nr:hypothetical protein [Oscillospiraceae bacterium]
MRANFTNTLMLTKFMLRRERIISSVWIVILVFFSVSLVPGITEVLGAGGDNSPETTLEMLTAPPMIAMMGPLYDTSEAGLFAFTMLLWTLLAVGLMNIFLIVRHTRTDEEKGRTEVIRSLPVGRLSILGGAVLTAVIVNTVLAVLTGAGMAAAGSPEVGFDFAGCMLYGVLLGVFGLFCAALTAIFCQLCVNARSALAFPAIVMTAGYMLRAVGDMPTETGEMPREFLSYLTPLGLLQRSQVFAGNHLWSVFAVLGLTAALILTAFALNRARDMGEGFIPAKPGRREADRNLLAPFGLQHRLLTNMLLWWGFGLALTGSLYGLIMGDIGGFIENNEFYGDLMISLPPGYEHLQEKSFVATISIILMICASIPVMAAIFRLRKEESDGRLENILAGAASRKRTLAGYVLFAFAASVLIPLVTAFGFWGVAAAVMENPLEVGFFLDTMLVYLPALWIMLAVAVAIVGWLPKGGLIAWGYMVYSVFVLFLGQMLNLPDFFGKITPFGHVPTLILPDDSVNFATMAVMTAIAAGLTAIGFAGYSRRDYAPQ